MRILKATALSLLMTVSITQGVRAADAVYPEVVMADKNFDQRWSWTGVTVGVTGGYSWQKDQTVSTAFGQLANAEGDGDVYGIFVGYNHQFGNLVAGIEASYEDYSNTFTDGSGVVIEDIWSLKGRLGYAFDRVLGYGLVGVGFGNTTSPFANLEGHDLGLIVGAGVDVAITDNIFIGAEYNHLRYNDFANLDLTPGGAPADAGINAQMNTIKARVGYKF